jgi:hypothetical protein
MNFQVLIKLWQNWFKQKVKYYGMRSVKSLTLSAVIHANVWALQINYIHELRRPIFQTHFLAIILLWNRKTRNAPLLLQSRSLKLPNVITSRIGQSSHNMQSSISYKVRHLYRQYIISHISFFVIIIIIIIVIINNNNNKISICRPRNWVTCWALLEGPIRPLLCLYVFCFWSALFLILLFFEILFLCTALKCWMQLLLNLESGLCFNYIYFDGTC